MSKPDHGSEPRQIETPGEGESLATRRVPGAGSVEGLPEDDAARETAEVERQRDDTLDDSFPASDPPSASPGAD
jgi:hypothetical protein